MVKFIDTALCPRRVLRSRVWVWLFVGGVICQLAGCSLFVMAGKMLFGDPLNICDFTSQTHVDLMKEEKTVLVICSTPESVKVHWPSLDFDILEGVSRNLMTHDIKVVKLDKVATWIDENGGEFEDPSELAAEFDADYIIHIDLNQFSYHEEHSNTLFRGRATGNVMAYRIVKSKEKGKSSAQTLQVFSQEFNSEYPTLQPIPKEQMNEKSFQQIYLAELCEQLARKFYNYRLGDTF